MQDPETLFGRLKQTFKHFVGGREKPAAVTNPPDEISNLFRPENIVGYDRHIKLYGIPDKYVIHSGANFTLPDRSSLLRELYTRIFYGQRLTALPEELAVFWEKSIENFPGLDPKLWKSITIRISARTEGDQGTRVMDFSVGLQKIDGVDMTSFLTSLETKIKEELKTTLKAQAVDTDFFGQALRGSPFIHNVKIGAEEKTSYSSYRVNLQPTEQGYLIQGTLTDLDTHWYDMPTSLASSVLEISNKVFALSTKGTELPAN